jgi:hypothetical protein
LPDPPRTLSLETYTAEELICACCLAHDQPAPLHFLGNLLDFVDHDPADSLFSKVTVDDDLIDLDRVCCDLHTDYCNELADKFTEESARGNAGGRGLRSQKTIDGVVIRGLDRPGEELLTSHDRLGLTQFCHAFAAYGLNK